MSSVSPSTSRKGSGENSSWDALSGATGDKAARGRGAGVRGEELRARRSEDGEEEAGRDGVELVLAKVGKSGRPPAVEAGGGRLAVRLASNLEGETV